MKAGHVSRPKALQDQGMLFGMMLLEVKIADGTSSPQDQLGACERLKRSRESHGQSSCRFC